MTVLIVGIVTVVSIPTGDDKTQDEIQVITGQFESDVAYARGASIANPEDPMVLKVDPDGDCYWLARSSNPDKWITHPFTGAPFKRSFKQADNPRMRDVEIIGCDVGTDNVLKFDPKGETASVAPSIVWFRVGTANYEVSVAPATTDVKVVATTSVPANLGGTSEGTLVSEGESLNSGK